MAFPEVVRAGAAVGGNAPQVPAGRAVVADVLRGGDARRARHLHPARPVPAPQVEVEVGAGGAAQIAVLEAGVAIVVGAARLVLGGPGADHVARVVGAAAARRRAVEGDDAALVIRLGGGGGVVAVGDRGVHGGPGDRRVSEAQTVADLVHHDALDVDLARAPQA